MTYASDSEVELAAELGFEVTRGVQRGHSFKKGSRRIWAIREGWQTADVINDHYTNHKTYPHGDLEGALRRPLHTERCKIIDQLVAKTPDQDHRVSRCPVYNSAHKTTEINMKRKQETKILVGFEESQTIAGQFRSAGYDAYSCDILETRGDPEFHYQRDVLEVIPIHRWDLIILHPDCHAMALSGNRWYGRGMPRHQERIEAVRWTCGVWELAVRYGERVAMENPKSVLFPALRDQYNCDVFFLQPWQHGHGEVKETGFALHSLPRLTPSNIVAGREPKVWKMAPSPTRKRDRSKTFHGVGAAIVSQWGPLAQQIPAVNPHRV